VTLTLDIARDTKFKDTDVLVEGKYALSKRTFAYAAVLRDGKGKATAGNPTGLTNVTGYSVGVRHNF
jgi:predicted porin